MAAPTMIDVVSGSYSGMTLIQVRTAPSRTPRMTRPASTGRNGSAGTSPNASGSASSRHTSTSTTNARHGSATGSGSDGQRRWEFGLAFLAAVRDDQAGAPVAAVRDHGGVADGVLDGWQLPCIAVVAVAGQRLADGDDETGVGADDDPVVGGLLAVFRMLGDDVAAGRERGAVHHK